MFRTVGSKASRSVRRSPGNGVGNCSRSPLSWSQGTTRRNLSDLASQRTTMTLRSWRGQQIQRFREGGTRATTIKSLPSRLFGVSQARTFFSPTQQEILRSTTSRFTPAEEFLMDAIAWTFAFSLWYLLNMEVNSDLLGDTADGDSNDDRHLEYREDYGPTISPWPSTPSPTGDKRRNTPQHKSSEGNPKGKNWYSRGIIVLSARAM